MDKALRYNVGKPKMSMLLEAGDALRGVTAVLEFGAEKYARSNFLKGLPYTEVVDSMLRHLTAFMQGEDIDPESKLHHAHHVACNALFLAQFVATHPQFDDRPAKPELPASFEHLWSTHQRQLIEYLRTHQGASNAES